MTSTLDRLTPVAAPGRIGQGTAVEQSRAVAEVQAQVIVAQQMPRSIERANREMLRSCAMRSLAEKAFYRYSRGGSQISGPTVQLARELARCFGNVQYGITELRRDDQHGQSEMMAFAWDVETNTRSATTFIVQHVRGTRNGPTALTDQRDIYELNANNGARRLREMIFAILPGWYTEDAVSACYATLASDNSDGATVAERAATAVAKFGRIGVTTAQLEQKLGAPQARWAPSDLAQLAVIFKSIERRETTAEAEFGTAAADRITPDSLAPPPKDVPPAETPAAAADEAAAAGGTRPPAKIASGQKEQLEAQRKRLGYGDTEEDWSDWLADLAKLAGVAALATPGELTQPEAAGLIKRLKALPDMKALRRLLDTGEVPDGQ